MKLLSSLYLLFISALWLAPTISCHDPTDSTPLSIDELESLYHLRTYNDWTHPEDLPAMPQCIAQQDQTLWLSTLTSCTHKQCTRHFGIICTHHQWLTSQSCLATSFSPQVIARYAPYCSRSVLAKKQLYDWVKQVAERTWLVEVEDADGLDYLSTRALVKGYKEIGIVERVPWCLGKGVSEIGEGFQRTIESCGFESKTRHTGNAKRPWEYRESEHSMVSLDVEVAGYNLTIVDPGWWSSKKGSIPTGKYFDRDCFCKTFTVNRDREPCFDQEEIEMTKERLWITATCGPKALFGGWDHNLLTTENPNFIPRENWKWPGCGAGMPMSVRKLPEVCSSDICELDSEGYCKEKPQSAVSRSCFCENVSYDSCGGSCHDFDTRIEYVNWLHSLCGGVDGWNGLPENWTRLAAPLTEELMPWSWRIKPSKEADRGNCADREWKLGNFIWLNIALLFAATFSKTIMPPSVRGFISFPETWSWFYTGFTVAVLQLVANFHNASNIQNTAGYSDVPVLRVFLHFCTIPRVTWLPVLLVAGSVQPIGALHLSAAAAAFFAEMVFQCLSSYPMLTTVRYATRHNLYFADLSKVQRGDSAQLMYYGALLWVVILMTSFAFMIWKRIAMAEAMEKRNAPYSSTPKSSDSGTACCREDASEHTALLGRKGIRYEEGYGTLPLECNADIASPGSVAQYYLVLLCMILLWAAQWLFWTGYVTLSAEEFCPPKFGQMTTRWFVFSFPSTIVALRS